MEWVMLSCTLMGAMIERHRQQQQQQKLIKTTQEAASQTDNTDTHYDIYRDNVVIMQPRQKEVGTTLLETSAMRVLPATQVSKGWYKL